MASIPANNGRSARRYQRGAALMLVLVLVSLLIAMFAVVFVNDLVRQNQKQKRTAEVLAKAKEALIGYAVGIELDVDPIPPCGTFPSWTANNCPRPGDLPCPSAGMDGIAAGTCGNATGSNQSSRLGRLPWRTLGLDELRDGDGELLWYAVSNNFKYNTRTVCTSPDAAGCLNSNSRGTISLRNRDGGLLNDGNAESGVIAVLVAPGAALQRTDSAATQDRSAAGIGNPANYLDIGGGEDNANFVDNDSNNGFINGPILDANNRPIMNDSVLVITYADLMPLLQRRVAQETLNCVNAYAASSHGRYPWAARVDLSATISDYSSQQNYRFGRVPNTFASSLLGILPATGQLAGLVTTVCGLTPGLCMNTAWPTASATPACNIPQGGAPGGQAGLWWMNWKDSVFYGFATNNQPEAPNTTSTLSYLLGLPNWLLSFFFTPVTTPAACGSPGNCITVNPPSPTVGRKVVVVVAGRSLASVAGGQPRTTTTDRSNIANYLEDINALIVPNSGSDFAFTQQPMNATFNDFLLYE